MDVASSELMPGTRLLAGVARSTTSGAKCLSDCGRPISLKAFEMASSSSSSCGTADGADDDGATDEAEG